VAAKFVEFAPCVKMNTWLIISRIRLKTETSYKWLLMPTNTYYAAPAAEDHVGCCQSGSLSLLIRLITQEWKAKNGSSNSACSFPEVRAIRHDIFEVAVKGQDRPALQSSGAKYPITLLKIGPQVFEYNILNNHRQTDP